MRREGVLTILSEVVTAGSYIHRFLDALFTCRRSTLINEPFIPVEKLHDYNHHEKFLLSLEHHRIMIKPNLKTSKALQKMRRLQSPIDELLLFLLKNQSSSYEKISSNRAVKRAKLQILHSLLQIIRLKMSMLTLHFQKS